MTKREQIEQWFAENPEGTQSECAAAVNANKSTVSRVYNALHPGRKQHSGGKRGSAHIDRPDRSERTERITITVTPEQKQKLSIIVAVQGTTISDWIADKVAEEYTTITLPK